MPVRNAYTGTFRSKKEIGFNMLEWMWHAPVCAEAP